MGARISNRDVIHSPALRWLLFTALVLLGFVYIGLYTFFFVHSDNFIVAQRNRKALQFSVAHPTSMPAAWTFGSGAADDAHLGSGWAPVPIGGVQMVTPDAWIVFTTSPSNSDALLTLNTIFFTTRDAPVNRVDVSVNGQLLGSWQRGASMARTPIEVSVAHKLVSTGQWNVRIHVERVASLFRPDVGAQRNGQHVVLTTMTLRATDDNVATHSNGSVAPAR